MNKKIRTSKNRKNKQKMIILRTNNKVVINIIVMMFKAIHNKKIIQINKSEI
jgi:hypothetical protein